MVKSVCGFRLCAVCQWNFMVVSSWNISWSTAGSLDTEELSKVLCCFGVIPEDVVKKSLASIHLVAFCFSVVVH